MLSATLWLFDIDGTLVDTGGAGMRSLQEAAIERFGDRGPALDLAGSTDLGVLAGIFGHFGQACGPADADAFFASYLRRLEWNLAHGGFGGRVLPGVLELLDHLASQPGVSVGLLTGNIAGGAAAKMRHFGLDGHFGFGAYGCDHADRNVLGPVALQRAARHVGRDFKPEDALVIGDTPKDIACARALGAPCLAVATGAFTVDALRDAGADRVVASLSELFP
ncbi:MAG: HAD family hydrolase [Verrucomicrobia bacterium]|nr:MAG: HAD family hydrolase [Verrucomicrobiota bacterium]TAE87797.1 MAG: HAD family hydrolase [Verrucomicrobiota bacterium]TAF25540.1 MAG: HAD family hydrolase [Verrucomicrobiota bacterium]TAF41393.1 MAG: HAD family hydrolase [Verrucomicrobiota bacterium]